MTSNRLSLREAAAHLWAAVRLALAASAGSTVGYLLNAVVAGVTPVIAAWQTKLVLDRLAASDGWSALTAPVAGLVALGVLMGVSPAIGQYLFGRLNRRVAVLAMDQLYEAVDRLTGVSRIEDPAFRDRLLMAQQAGRGGPGRLVEQAIGVGRTTLTVTGFLGTLLVLSPGVAFIALAAALPALMAQLRISRARAALFMSLAPMERRELHYAELLVSVPAAKELRLLGLGGLFRTRMVGEMRTANAAQDRQDGRELRTEGVLVALTAALSGGCLVWAVWLAAQGRFSVGDVAVFIAATAGLQGSLQSIIELIGGAHEALLLFHQYRTVVAAGPDLPTRDSPAAAMPLYDGIELADVWFRYGPDLPWVLRGVTLELRRGHTLALVGLNGAGKSTLIKLLCRFYDPTRGAIRWDGTDLRDLDPRQLRERIGAVFQDFMEYDLSAAENIGVGDLAGMHDRARIVSSARRADAHDMLAALPRGYDTLLSRTFTDEADLNDPATGTLLSGGQWQRVALARAFMRDQRDLMILDEPSSGLDPEAEHEIHRRLRSHRASGTSVLVSHRLASVRDADEIVVLSAGRVHERGSHDELIAADGVYARLFRLQADGYARPSAALAGPSP